MQIEQLIKGIEAKFIQNRLVFWYDPEQSFRAGWSGGGAPLMNKTITVGLVQRFFTSDLMGVGFNWGDPSNNALRDQYTTELYYRWQMAENIVFTPSV